MTPERTPRETTSLPKERPRVCLYVSLLRSAISRAEQPARTLTLNPGAWVRGASHGYAAARM